MAKVIRRLDEPTQGDADALAEAEAEGAALAEAEAESAALGEAVGDAVRPVASRPVGSGVLAGDGLGFARSAGVS